MRFNYVREGAPDVVDRLRSVRISKPLQWPVSVLVAIVLTYLVAAGVFAVAIASEKAVETQAAARLESSKAALAWVRLERVRVDALLALDARLRRIRTSGSRLSAGFADIANHIPAHAWLTTIARTQNGIEITGRSAGLPALGETMTTLMRSTSLSSPTLVRAGKEERGRILSFEVHGGLGAP